MGIGDFISDITPDSMENAVEDGVEWVGDKVEGAGNWTADRLDDVGWESGADWVREQSRSVANRMGAEVDEMDLGQTEDKTKLIYGSAEKIRSTAEKLRGFQSAFDNAGEGLRGLDSSQLKGEAAEALRKAVSTQPPKWFTGADACEKAAAALEAFAGTVTWAQGQAQTAIDKWKEGVKASEEAADAHRKKIDDFNAAVDRHNADPDKYPAGSLPPRPSPTFTDPGKKLMQDAQDILADARKQRNTAAETARSAVRAARDTAPEKPTYAEQALSGLQEMQIMGDHVGGGIIKGTAGLLNFVRGVNPLDPYNITHPAEYTTNLNNLAAGLVLAANDPVGTGKQMVSDFMKDPAEGFGRLIPDLALTAATGGGGAAVKGIRVADELADAAAAGRHADPPSVRPRDPDGPACRPADSTPCVGEPIDVATGAMLMTQTDVTLPADGLPLVFRRTHLSSFRAGLLFGPTWMSTLDECLQVDDEGVVLAAADGMRLTFPVPSAGAPTTPIGGERWSLTWDGHPDGIMTVTDPVSGIVRTFGGPGVPAPGVGALRLPLREMSDRNGGTVTVDRDDRGMPTALCHSGGYWLAVDRHEHLITALRLLDAPPSPYDRHKPDAAPGTVVVRYGYDLRGRLVEVVNSSGKPLRFAYDDEDRIDSWTDRNGTTFTYVYDDEGRVTRTEGSDGFQSGTLTYDNDSRVTTYTNSLGRTSVHRYDERGHVIEETDPLGNVTRTVRDRLGRAVEVTDPLGRTTSYTFDDVGRMTGINMPDGSSARSVLNELGLPLEVEEPNGGVWRHTFDDRGNLLSTIDPLGACTRYTYDDTGRLRSVVDALGGARHVTPNAAGLPVAVTDERGRTTTVRRDTFGRPVEITDPLGRTTRLGWTVEGLPAWRQNPDGGRETWVWDGEGNPLSHTDLNGATTRHTFTHFDTPTTRVSPDGSTTAFVHDTELRLARVTDPRGLTWSYDYDPAGRLVSETDFNGRTVRYVHDAAGSLVSRTNGAGQTVHYIRDTMGRVVTRHAADGTELTRYTYDAAGRLVRASEGHSEVVLSYDELGRILSESVDGRTTSYAYDALGRRTKRVTPSGLTTWWLYDETGRPVELRSEAGTLTFAYDEAGQEVTRRLDSEIALSQSWDEAGRLTSQTLNHTPADASRQLLQHRSYRYRPDDRLTEIRDLTSGTRRFGLDPGGRPISVQAAGWAESYAYDASGSLTEASAPGHASPGSRVLEGTLLRRAGRTSYEYDGQCRLVARVRRLLNGQRRQWRYSWDEDDRLTEVVSPDGAVWRYSYDALGRRTAKYRVDEKASGDERVVFAWDGTVLAEQRTEDGEVTTWEYEPGTHRPLAQLNHRPLVREPGRSALSQLDGSTDGPPLLHAVITDPLGTPTELVSPAGELVWQMRTTLWGAAVPSFSDTVECPLRFPGQYADEESGLHHNYFRLYDPETGHYTAPDPLGLAAGPNPHRYVLDPLTWADPYGLAPCRTRPRLETGNLKEGWEHIEARHITGTHPSTKHSDMLPPTTTREQVERAARELVDGGMRVSDPEKRIQTYERHLTVNGMHATFRVSVDSHDGNRVITFHPVGKSWTP
ncbi:putative T7SS-secreted protein [Streptomyces sp. MJP52]|uniref:putative T7SS-secreted protein n=1 Tax=Streptomyces sp. MJP52 TaxID=2940555 RepID=UPI002475BCE0|nr:RHS repeat-associated core domain-containing protein [Streptomyces sp. MJP52]MDH6223612.1 RHS repeat-associated protein [Streptomyces sp. MJP52]